MLASATAIVLGPACALGVLAVSTAVVVLVWGLVEERRERSALARLADVGATISARPRPAVVERSAA